MKPEDSDRWVAEQLAKSKDEHKKAERDVLAFVFFCGAVVLVVVIAELLAV